MGQQTFKLREKIVRTDNEGNERVKWREFDCRVTVPCADTREQVRIIAREFNGDAVDFTAELPELPEDEAEYNRFVRNNPEVMKTVINGGSSHMETKDYVSRKILRSIIDTEPLSDHDRELVESDANGTFWRRQNMEEVERVVKDFRDRNSC